MDDVVGRERFCTPHVRVLSMPEWWALVEELHRPT